MPSIWWIRRDLRLGDNRALHAALDAAGGVVSLFIVDPTFLSSAFVGSKRWDFLVEGLLSLHESLVERGNRLVVRCGPPQQVLAQLMAESGARAIYAEADYSPYATVRDTALAQRLPLRLVDGLTALPVGSVLKSNREPYTVFTPFKRRWLEVSQTQNGEPLPAPARIPALDCLTSDPLPASCAPRSPPPVKRKRGTVCGHLYSRQMPLFMTTRIHATDPIARVHPGCRPICALGCSRRARLLRLGRLRCVARQTPAPPRVSRSGFLN